ncbi:MAG: Holliday junction resolvase RuvX [Candidatus Marinimicrobia bacterium]|nr:Holliday junction resolvase RuvX [Candidatus Neomarinimicrobiota bacterium]MCH8836455.1 Holliday junction resolvase RuvX [Candidatus Neomarinimicrobiota bacterium]
MTRILGIDFGERRVGLAVSDPLKIIAQPLLTLIRDAGDGWWNQLEAVISEQEIELAVVGYPLTMSGEQGRQTKVVDKFIADLERNLALPVERYDERLTTVAARKALQQQGIKTGHNKEMVDRTAAALFLQNYLDSHP